MVVVTVVVVVGIVHGKVCCASHLVRNKYFYSV